MLARIEALNYRSLRYVSQRVSRFQTLVGPNGSGKSTFLDVVAFLGDLLRVGPYRAILGDGVSVPRRAPDFNHLTWMRTGSRFELAVELEVPENRRGRREGGDFELARYEVALEKQPDTQEIVLAAETLWLSSHEESEAPSPRQRDLFPFGPTSPDTLLRGAKKPRGGVPSLKVVNKTPDSANDFFHSETTKWNNSFRLGPHKSALANLPEDEERFPIATWVKRFLMEGIIRVALNAEAMRLPSPAGSPLHFLPDGANLPWVVQGLKDADPAQYGRWIAHLRTALPDIQGISTVIRPEDNHRYLVVEYENGLQAPSWVVSDGTLRMIALTLLADIRARQAIYLIEEPENGIHPRAVETVFESLAGVLDSQVLCASHSPIVLGLAKPVEILCFAKDEQGATDVVRGDEHPQLKDWRGEINVGTLFAAGVLG